MTAGEQGMLLMTSTLGDPARKPLTVAQFRKLTQRVRRAPRPSEDRDMTEEDIIALGYNREDALRILTLLSEKGKLRQYLQKAEEAFCQPITRVSPQYPRLLRRRLELDTPGCLWAKGDLSILSEPAISVVGSRELEEPNSQFAAQVGRQAALQNYVLISGNARGADTIAQKSCLAAGGKVIAIVPDALWKYPLRENMLYLSADSFDAPFTSQRALYRNQLIHCMGQKVFVAQCSLGKGGTWSGTVNNLKHHYSDVFCFRDDSKASVQLSQLGAALITGQDLLDIGAFICFDSTFTSLFDTTDQSDYFIVRCSQILFFLAIIYNCRIIRTLNLLTIFCRCIKIP